MYRYSYILKYKSNGLELNKEAYKALEHLYNLKLAEFNIMLIDENGIIDERFNTIFSKFIKECLQEKNRCFAIPEIASIDDFNSTIKQFLENLYKYIILETTNKDENYERFNCILGRKYFHVYIPNNEVSKKQKDEFLNLGQDFLIASFNSNLIFKYVVPAFFYFIVKNSLKEKKDINLENYMVGLR